MPKENYDLSATNPTTGRVTVIGVNQTNDVGIGGESKQFVEGTVTSNSGLEKKVYLIERHFLFRGMTELESAQVIYNLWKTLKERGFPVVPTMRFSDHDTLLITDVTHDGSIILGKGKAIEIRNKRHYSVLEDTPPQNEVEQLFVREYPLIKRKIEEQANVLAQFATDQNVTLPHDDAFELLFHPDGSWELIILDLNNANLEGGGFQSGRTLQESNRYSVSYVLTSIDRIYHGLTRDLMGNLRT